MSIKIKLREPQNPKRYGGTTPLEVKLNEEDLEPVELEGLRHLAERLAKQMSERSFRDEPDREVIGVKLLTLDFSLITDDKIQAPVCQCGRHPHDINCPLSGANTFLRAGGS